MSISDRWQQVCAYLLYVATDGQKRTQPSVNSCGHLWSGQFIMRSDLSAQARYASTRQSQPLARYEIGDEGRYLAM